jgi:CheY-like chemotaxis protein
MATTGCSSEIPLLVIVDDDASTRISTQRVIRSFGFRTEVFTSARQFLESDCVQDISCLILDLRLPSMNGLQLQRLLASGFRQVPLIFVSEMEVTRTKEKPWRQGRSIFCLSRSTNQHWSGQFKRHCCAIAATLNPVDELFR